LTKQLFFQSVNASVSYSLSADSTVFSARCVTLYFIHFSHKFHPFLLSISVTNFMSDLKRALVIELFWTQSRCHGGFGALSPQTKLPAPQIQI